MSSEDAALEALVALGDPVRRGLYRHVSGTPGEVGRDAAAEAVGVSRSLAAFHLDKLVEAGLLEVCFRRLSGRSGPGSGRPSKLYRRAEGERTVSVPPRSYDTASRPAGRGRGAGRARRGAPGGGQGRRGGLGGEPGCEADPVEVLRARGYEPFWDEGTLRLNNCPFHALADQFPALVCGMNLAGIEGLLKGCPAARTGARRWPPSARVLRRARNREEDRAGHRSLKTAFVDFRRFARACLPP